MGLEPGVALGLVAALCWGVGDFLAKGTMERGGFVPTVLWVNLVGTLLTIPLLSLFPPAALGPYAVPLLLSIGLVTFTAQLFFYRAFQIGNISIVSPISSIYPSVTILLALVLLHEDPGPIRLLGAGLALGATALMARAPASPSQDLRRWALGVPHALVAMAAIGTGLLLIKLATLQGTGPALPLVAVRASGVVGFGLLGVRGGSVRRPPMEALRRVAAMGALDSAAFLCYSVGVAGGLVAVVSPLSALYAAVTVFLAWILLRESFQLHQVLALGPLFLGVLLISS